MKSRIEGAAVLVAGAVATLYVEWNILRNPWTYQTDALIHEYWMRRFQDPALFNDPLTEALLKTGYSPPLYRFFYWLGSHAVDPVFLGELLPLVLAPFAAWLVFRIVRAHTAWAPAAWIGAALFLLPWEIHRFSGGHPRAFAQPIFLLALFLLIRRRFLAAAGVPVVGVLVYPPAALTALALVALAAVERGRPFLLDPRRAVIAFGSAAAVAAVALIPRLVTPDAPELISAARARDFPEFGPSGQMHFFATSTLQYLKQNYSGFHFATSGSILAVSALLLLVVRPSNARLIRWEVWATAVASLFAFGAAHAVLFQLYLPQRYTYPLIAFFAIAIAVALRPTLRALVRRSRIVGAAAALALPAIAVIIALTVFPFGPRLTLADAGAWLVDGAAYLTTGAVVGVVAAAAAALRAPLRITRSRWALTSFGVVSGAILVACVGYAGRERVPAPACDAALGHDTIRYLGTLPKDAVIAGDPVDLDCIPIATRRPVVISRKLYQPWEVRYFATIRPRMFDMVRGYYGSSVAALVRVRERYGADYLLVRNRLRQRPWSRMAPFTQEMQRLLRMNEVSASHSLPLRCQTWRGDRFRVYDLSCVQADMDP